MSRPAPDTTVADVVAHCLVEAGVRRVYGVPGEHCLALVDAIGRHPDLELVTVRQESHAAFMAEADAKLTGRLGACLGSASVGVTNLSAGVNVAQHDSTPMVVLAGQVSTTLRGRDAWQELDLVRLLDTLCSSSVELVNPATAAEVVRRALALAVAGRPGPVAVVLPEDVQSLPSQPPSDAAPPLVAPPALSQEVAARIAGLLRSAHRPVVIAGGGIRAGAAREELVHLTQRAVLPVATGFRRPEAFPDDHPNWLGSLGLGAHQGTLRALAEADLVLAVGTRLSELTTQRYRFPAAAQRFVHLDLDPVALARFPVPADVRACADAGEALAAINAELAGSAPRRPRWWAEYSTASAASGDPAERAGRPDEPECPATRFLTALNRLLPEDGVVTSDAGDFFIPVVRTLRYLGTRRYLGPTSGTMGYGLPSAIAAKLAAPGRAAVACCGDGGFLMSMCELATVRQLGLGALVIAVFRNDAYGSIRRHQRDRYAGRYFGVELVNPDLGDLARAFGLRAARLDEHTDAERVLTEALDARTATLVDIPLG